VVAPASTTIGITPASADGSPPIHFVVGADIEQHDLPGLPAENQDNPIRVRQPHGVFPPVLARERMEPELGRARVGFELAKNIVEDPGKFCMPAQELARGTGESLGSDQRAGRHAVSPWPTALSSGRRRYPAARGPA
jgi:hypothetical protein